MCIFLVLIYLLVFEIAVYACKGFSYTYGVSPPLYYTWNQVPVILLSWRPKALRKYGKVLGKIMEGGKLLWLLKASLMVKQVD